MSRALNEPVVHAGADVSADAAIGLGTVVWPLAQVREDVTIGQECIIGRGAYIDAGVVVGSRCKIQNHALVYHPARLGDGVFVGPAAVFTNDGYPRAVRPDGELKTAVDWEAEGVTVLEGASIGARAVVLAGVTIGCWALVGAGAVVTRPVPDFALVVGNPARRVGWVGRSGVRLTRSGDREWTCPEDGTRYLETDEQLTAAT